MATYSKGIRERKVTLLIILNALRTARGRGPSDPTCLCSESVQI